jgi:hypothetical protein
MNKNKTCATPLAITSLMINEQNLKKLKILQNSTSNIYSKEKVAVQIFLDLALEQAPYQQKVKCRKTENWVHSLVG